jgi:hypothetical protein
MQIAFLIERMTRDLTRRLGSMAMDHQSAVDMANLGQALMIGNCDLNRTIRKLSRAIQNIQPAKCIIACSSYELADQIDDECRDAGIAARLHWSNDTLPRDIADLSVIVTVPESLHRLRAAVAAKSFVPAFLFLFDPNGTTFRGRTAEWGGGNRAGNLSTFRAACLAMGVQIPPVVFVNSTPAAFSLDSICRSLGVEALVYADGCTLRTALYPDADAVAPAVEIQETPVEQPLTSQLDGPVTAARQAKSRVLLHVSPKLAQAADLLAQLAALRNYPTISLKPLLSKAEKRLLLSSGSDRRVLRDIADNLTKQVMLINKQVVIGEDADLFYDALSPRNALFVMGHLAASSLLTLPGPSGLSGKDIRDLCTDIKRIQPDFTAPSLYEPGEPAHVR